MSKSSIVGWVLSGLLAAFLIFASASAKFTDWEGKDEMFATLGWSEDMMFKIGIVEVAIAIVFLIPRAAFVGTILLTAYMGGAVATHIRAGDPFYVPIVIAIAMWIALGLRDPRVFSLAFQKSKVDALGNTVLPQGIGLS